jgi:hypothetical protein
MRDTIDMAREAGNMRINNYYTNGTVTAFSDEQLKAFEALVRADEREACAKAVEAEAHMFETLAAAKSLASAIRARGETK